MSDIWTTCTLTGFVNVCLSATLCLSNEGVFFFFFSILLYFAISFSIDFYATLFFNNNSKMNLKNDSKELNLETAALDIHCNSSQ